MAEAKSIAHSGTRTLGLLHKDSTIGQLVESTNYNTHQLRLSKVKVVSTFVDKVARCGRCGLLPWPSFLPYFLPSFLLSFLPSFLLSFLLSFLTSFPVAIIGTPNIIVLLAARSAAPDFFEAKGRRRLNMCFRVLSSAFEHTIDFAAEGREAVAWELGSGNQYTYSLTIPCLGQLASLFNNSCHC